jgi:hypothetical protein
MSKVKAQGHLKVIRGLIRGYQEGLVNSPEHYNKTVPRPVVDRLLHRLSQVNEKAIAELEDE